MVDEPEEALEERLERLQLRAENFRELLKEGEEVTIAFQDGKVRVDESYRSKLERLHPKLFGRMLSIEAQMETGLFPYFAALVAAGIGIIGLHLKWWDAWLGEDVCVLLNQWWFYIVLPMSLVYLIYLGCGRWAERVYRRHRESLFELIAAEGLDRDIMLVMLREESDVDDVVYQLKLDAGPFVAPA